MGASHSSFGEMIDSTVDNRVVPLRKWFKKCFECHVKHTWLFSGFLQVQNKDTAALIKPLKYNNFNITPNIAASFIRLAWILEKKTSYFNEYCAYVRVEVLFLNIFWSITDDTMPFKSTQTFLFDSQHGSLRALSQYAHTDIRMFSFSYSSITQSG